MKFETSQVEIFPWLKWPIQNPITVFKLIMLEKKLISWRTWSKWKSCVTDLRQVSIVGRLREVEFVGVEIGEHPGEHRVLVQVVVRPTCKICNTVNQHHINPSNFQCSTNVDLRTLRWIRMLYEKCIYYFLAWFHFKVQVHFILSQFN